MSVLADTSIWIGFLRDGRDSTADELDRLLRDHSVLLCGPIVAELLAGTRGQDRAELWRVLGSLPWAEIDHTSWREAGELAHTLRSGGQSVPLIDLLIAVAAVRADAAVWTRDRDFERISEILPALSLYGR